MPYIFKEMALSLTFTVNFQKTGLFSALQKESGSDTNHILTNS